MNHIKEKHCVPCRMIQIANLRCLASLVNKESIGLHNAYALAMLACTSRPDWNPDITRNCSKRDPGKDDPDPTVEKNNRSGSGFDCQVNMKPSKNNLSTSISIK